MLTNEVRPCRVCIARELNGRFNATAAMVIYGDRILYCNSQSRIGHEYFGADDVRIAIPRRRREVGARWGDNHEQSYSQECGRNDMTDESKGIATAHNRRPP